jgi:flagellin-like protein
MKKLLRSKKALSPVIAAIILIAVTVAVSIAVAAWMGALTFTFMGSSSITITNVDFCDNALTPDVGSGVANNTIVLTLKNSGTKQVIISTVKVNNVVKTLFTGDTTLSPGDTGKTLNIWMGGSSYWTNGNPYKIDLYDSSGQGVGSTQQNAPGA